MNSRKSKRQKKERIQSKEKKKNITTNSIRTQIKIMNMNKKKGYIGVCLCILCEQIFCLFILMIVFFERKMKEEKHPLKKKEAKKNIRE